MPYIPPDVVAKVKEMDLLTYLRYYEPEELVHFGGDTYCTREHDSLKISNGKWYWFSRRIGGKTALDYLIKVKEMPFVEAVERITGQAAVTPIPIPAPKPKPQQEKVLLLPKPNRSCHHVMEYLCSRGIDSELIDFCFSTGRLYESYPHHNAVFVGHDRYGKPQYGNLRGTHSDFKGECNGSNKRYSFNIPSPGSGILHVFESAIDLLSYATLLKLHGWDWHKDHLLSLAGIYEPPKNRTDITIPLALSRYLEEHPEINEIMLRLDRDYTGRTAGQALADALSPQYIVITKPPPQGKDYNDYLCLRKGIPISQPKKNQKER